jgi:uracil-DNA glycosylase
MSGSEAERVVYYEDITSAKPAVENVEPSATAKASLEAGAVAAKSSDAVSKPTVATAGTKRQRTIGEMFGPSTASAKKPKIGGSSGFSSQGLNSIPFSMTGFLESLNDEERDLLGLECETMGKSWSVC